MSIIRPILERAFEQFKQKHYAEAIALYEEKLGKDTKGMGEWDWLGCIQSYNALKQYDTALTHCRNGYKQWPQSNMLGKLYAQCIFYTQLAGNRKPADEATFEKAVQAMLKLSPPGGKYNFTAKAIFKWIKYLSEKQVVPWKKIGEWLDCMDVKQLSTEVFVIPGAGGKKDMEVASEVEEWYSWQTKYLLQTQQWKRCIEMVDAALAHLTKWHYSNDLWFLRRKAAALAKLGEIEKAKQMVNELLLRREEWFFYQDLALLEADGAKKAVLLAKAVVVRGDADKKVAVLQQLAECLALNEQREAAHAIGLYAVAIRQNANWAVPVSLEKLMQENGGMPGVILPPGKYEAAVQKACQSLLPAKQKGIIHKILEGRSAGFIQKANEGTTCYFRYKNCKMPPARIKEGLSVSFNVRQAFDKAKGRQSEEAVDITPEK